MTFQTWIISQPFQIKLLIGISAGIFIYGILRYIVHLANKDYKNHCSKNGNPLSEKNIRKRQEMQLRDSGY